MAELKTIGIYALLAMLGLGAASVPLGFWDKPHYYCYAKPSLGLNTTCASFSTTGTRCYPTENTTKGYIDCATGWQKIVNDSIPFDENSKTAEAYYAQQTEFQKQCQADGCMSG